MTDEQRVELWKWYAETMTVKPRVAAKVEVFVFEPPKKPVRVVTKPKPTRKRQTW